MPGCELPKTEGGGGPEGVNEFAEEGGGPAGVVDGWFARLLKEGLVKKPGV